MGFGDKLKGLKDQAQQTVADNKDKIQGAVQVVGEAANNKTHGKYAAKIMKVGDKVESSVDKFAAGDSVESSGDKFAGGAEEGVADAPAAAPSAAAADAPAAAPSAAAADAPTETPDPEFNIEGDAPQEASSEAPIATEPVSPVTPSAADQASTGFPEFE